MPDLSRCGVESRSAQVATASRFYRRGRMVPIVPRSYRFCPTPTSRRRLAVQLLPRSSLRQRRGTGCRGRPLAVGTAVGMAGESWRLGIDFAVGDELGVKLGVHEPRDNGVDADGWRPFGREGLVIAIRPGSS
jgi:hypothetical protein